jgi:hypothetical protein
MKTLLVNCFAGPGAGKTTCAWLIAGELKKLNINTEYAPEYAKELVYKKDFELLKNQEHMFKIQSERISIYNNHVDVIVTDAPILLSMIYGENNSPEFQKQIINEHNKYNNFNLFINRGKDFTQAGRIHNQQESIEIDMKIKGLLNDLNVYYGTYNQNNLQIIVNNICTTLKHIKETDNVIVQDDELEE